MFAYLTRLFASLGRLADSVNDLAGTTAEVNLRLRERLLLDAPADQPDRLALPAPAEEPAANGRRRKVTVE